MVLNLVAKVSNRQKSEFLLQVCVETCPTAMWTWTTQHYNEEMDDLSIVDRKEMYCIPGVNKFDARKACILHSFWGWFHLFAQRLMYGAIQVLRNTFFWKFDTYPPPRSTNNVEPYVFV